MLRHRFVGDLFGEEEGRHFFKLHPQLLGDFNVHFCESEPGSGFQAACERGHGVRQIVITHDLFLPTGHGSQHCRQIERVSVVADDALAEFRLFDAVRSDLRHAGFMIPRKDQALPSTIASFSIPYASLPGLYSLAPHSIVRLSR